VRGRLQWDSFSSSGSSFFFYNIRLFVYRAKKFPAVRRVRLAGGSWLVLICSERKVLLADCWWLVCFERKVLLAGG
jgi:hypothetical protein